MLGLVAIIEGWLGRHDLDFTTEWVVAWARSGWAVSHEGPRADVLCFGDSLVMRGIAPRILEQRLGRTSRNFAVYKGQAPTAYFLLKRALDAGARPSAVLIDGGLLYEDPLVLTRLWTELADYGELLDLAWTARDAGFFASTVVGKTLPSARMRFEVREGVLAALRGEYASARWEILPKVWNWRRNLGADIQPPVSPTPEGVVAYLNETHYRPTSWACNPVNAAYVERFLTLAGSRGIPVFWLLPPAQPEVQSRRDGYGFSADFERYFHGLVKRHANLTVLDGRHCAYPPQALMDMTHLNRTGACAFSASVGDVLRDCLTSAAPANFGRWIALPHYQEPEFNATVEDLFQTSERLRQAFAARAMNLRK